MATTAQQRSAREGVALGMVAGVLYALLALLATRLTGDSALMPFRMFASILMGRVALVTGSTALVVIVGSAVHVALSAFFGLLYGVFNARQSRDAQIGWGSQAALGMLFGVVVWLVNFQLIARLLYPWFLMTPQFMQMVMHALFFGLPLGLMYAGIERRVRHMPRIRV